jgi:tRNA wybutosine-synthesizing protein 3
MATFEEQKKKYLRDLEDTDPDRSKKGDVDIQIKPLLDAINAQDEFYTTSSCAGRIDLFVEPLSGKKHEGEWLYVSHDLAIEKELVASLQSLPQETLWFRMEGAILHVCAKDMDAANLFLQKCKESGWKHSGITGSTKRIIIEATTSERMDIPIAKDGVLLVPEKFVTFMVREANQKLSKTREKIKRLQEAF